MSIEKYYTPAIEDLHIGYKCEIDTGISKAEWNKHIWYSENFGDLDNDIIKVRTKYLDREDIESCEWKFEEVVTGTFGIQKYSAKNNKIKGADFKTWYTLHADFGYKEPRISIYTEFRGGMIYTESTNCIFKGECKSINELKILMKWLNI